MNPVDLLILAALVLFVFIGAKRGMIEELLGLTGWIIAILMAIKFGSLIARLVLSRVPSLPPTLASILGAAAVLIGVRVLFQVFSQFFQRMFGDDLQNTLDKLIGAIFGFIKGAFFISILTLSIYVLPLNENIKAVEHQSVLFGHMTKFAQVMVDWVIRMVPEIKKPLDQSLEKLDESDSPPPSTT
jgi:membrane protein required for colicin V production